MKHKIAILVMLMFLAIHMVFADDIRQVRLNPTWSPDGQHIVYMRSDGIRVMDIEGTNDRMITSPTGFGGWTADSSGVLIINNRYTENITEWWIYPIDGSEPIQLFPELSVIRDIEYSHDGEQVAISAQEDASELNQVWVANADGSQLRSIAEYETYSLSWALDNTSIVIETVSEDNEDHQIVQLSVNGSEAGEQELIALPQETILLGETLSFRYQVENSYRSTSYYITDVLDNDETLLTIDQLVSKITFSPRSHTIVYIAYCDPSTVTDSFLAGEWSADEQETVQTAMYSFDIDSMERSVLISCGNGSQMFASLSPTGEQILFTWIKDDRWDIYRMQLDDQIFINLTESETD